MYISSGSSSLVSHEITWVADVVACVTGGVTCVLDDVHPEIKTREIQRAKQRRKLFFFIYTHSFPSINISIVIEFYTFTLNIHYPSNFLSTEQENDLLIPAIFRSVQSLTILKKV